LLALLAELGLALDVSSDADIEVESGDQSATP
jgi:hypothetical protein